MFRGEPPKRKAFLHIQDNPMLFPNPGGADESTGFTEGDQAPVEQSIEVGVEQESVEHIQALLIIFADQPGFRKSLLLMTHKICIFLKYQGVQRIPFIWCHNFLI